MNGTFYHVRVGDTVTQAFGGTEIRLKLVVTAVNDDLIQCGGPDGWHFDRETGLEVDEELKWGPKYGITGTFLVEDK